MIDNIKVGGIDYIVIYTDLSAYDSNDSYRMGNTHEAKAIIEIRKEMPKQRQEQVLIHEMVHAMFYEIGIEMEDDEDIVNRVGLVLHQVLKDNDFSWLRK